ncbi:MAG: hypothetical protein A07HN63_02243 [uncultured archaeon A07HN63]|nr:MAG: hypothetical protein A07HN63_02243 [uncultured archaeon A07HN63]
MQTHTSPVGIDFKSQCLVAGLDNEHGRMVHSQPERKGTRLY